MSIDARLHPRHAILAHADILGTQVVLRQPVRDISVGGCQFEGLAWEEIGTQIEIVLSFADSQVHVPVRAQVVHASLQRWGVRFTGLNEDQRWAMRRAMTHLGDPLSRPSKTGTPER
jgi:hypothetical protein